MIVTPPECLSVLGERRLLPAARSAVYVAGSLVRGWGNARSDLDVYVVTTDPWPGEASSVSHVSVSPPTVPTHAFEVGGRRWDVEYWLERQVDALLDAVAWEAFESGRGSAASLSKHEIAFMQRLPFSLVVEGSEWVARRSREFDASAVKTMIAVEALYQLDLLAEDAVGMLAAGDTESAVLAARQAFGYAIEALLASHGEFNEQEKWRARRMASVAPGGITFGKYWEIETLHGFDPRAPGAWVEDVLRTCQKIATEVAL